MFMPVVVRTTSHPYLCNCLQSCGYFLYHQAQRSKILYFVRTMYLRILCRSWRVEENSDYFLTYVRGVCFSYRTEKTFTEMAVSVDVNWSRIESSKAKACVWLRRKKFEVFTAELTRIQVM